MSKHTRNAAINASIIDWRVIDDHTADLTIEFRGSFSDDNGSIIFHTPHRQVVRVETAAYEPDQDHILTHRPAPMRDPRRGGAV